jgi:hypothetical protein
VVWTSEAAMNRYQILISSSEFSRVIILEHMELRSIIILKGGFPTLQADRCSVMITTVYYFLDVYAIKTFNYSTHSTIFLFEMNTDMPNYALIGICSIHQSRENRRENGGCRRYY